MANRNKLLTLILNLHWALTPSVWAAAADEEAALYKGVAIVEQQQQSSASLKQSLASQSPNPEAQALRFMMRIEQQMFQLAGALDATIEALGRPVYQSRKTKVCGESSNLIATSRAMVRVIKEDSSLSIDTSDFELFVTELTQVRKDLRCQ